ncbi:MAG: HD domain-containing protein, partial [Bacilli bacterium]
MPNNIISNKDVISFNVFAKHITSYIHNPEDIKLLEKAYHYAIKYHEGQIRKSKEPYVNHVINVAIILAKLQVSPNVIAAGFLHDVVEDSQEVSSAQIRADFNEDIAIMVEAVTKLGNLQQASLAEYQAENHRKIFIAMSKDIRVILVKLADRLHNMLTLNYMSLEKQQKIAQETLDVYAPIAHRLGLAEIK